MHTARTHAESTFTVCLERPLPLCKEDRVCVPPTSLFADEEGASIRGSIVLWSMIERYASFDLSSADRRLRMTALAYGRSICWGFPARCRCRADAGGPRRLTESEDQRPLFWPIPERLCHVPPRPALPCCRGGASRRRDASASLPCLRKHAAAARWSCCASHAKPGRRFPARAL